MMDPGRYKVILRDLVTIIFEELHIVWLKDMWDADGVTHQDMIEIVYMLLSP